MKNISYEIGFDLIQTLRRPVINKIYSLTHEDVTGQVLAQVELRVYAQVRQQVMISCRNFLE